MKKLLLLFAFAGLLSCKSDNQPLLQNMSSQVIGRYLVTAYIVAGDTLFATPPISGSSKGGINKIGVDNFVVTMESYTTDQVIVSTSYWRKGLRSTFNKEVITRSLNDYYYGFSPIKEYAPTNYDAKVEKFTKVFTERTIGGGILIPLADSPNYTEQSTAKEVVIIAKAPR